FSTHWTECDSPRFAPDAHTLRNVRAGDPHAVQQPNAADERRSVSRQPTSRLRAPPQRAFARCGLRARIFKGQRPPALAADLGVRRTGTSSMTESAARPTGLTVVGWGAVSIGVLM